jgi:predicted nucleic acid-binding Zn ribbon protein
VVVRRSLEAIAADIHVKTVELLALMAELKAAREHKYIECRNCRAPIEVGVGAASTRRVFCSDRCRVAMDRNRKRA